MPGFSTSNKLLHKYEQEKNMRIHKQKLHAAKTTIDSKTPKKYPHVILRLKRIQMEEEKQSGVDHENKLLLQKMTQIMKSKPVIDNWNEYEPRSLNYGAREKAFRDIQYQNIGIARRLEKAKPVYQTDTLENEYQKKRYLQALWAENAKDFIEVTPRHLKYRQLKRHKEGDDLSEGDFESEDNSVYRHKIINRDSLPPIENGKSKNIRYMKEGGGDANKPKTTADKLPKLDKKWKVQHFYDMYHDTFESDGKQSDDGSVAGVQIDRSQAGSVQRGDNLNPQKTQMDNDARQLFNAAKVIGKVHPDDIIIRTLVRRSRKQRMQIKTRFEELYELELVPELKSGLGSDWYLLIDALLDEKLCSTSRMMHDALEEGNYTVAVEILSLCEPQALAELNEKYQKDYAVNLEGDIKDKTEAPEQTLLLALHKGHDESVKVNDKQAETDADELYESGDGRWSSETGPFLKIVNTRNFAHIRAVLNFYRVLSGGKDATEDVKAECPKQYADMLQTLLNFVKSGDTYFADKMFKIMSPKNPDYINMMVIHSEIDMPAIKRAYRKKYDAEMVDDMKHKCAGPTMNVLIELANKFPQGQVKKKRSSFLVPQPKRQPIKRPEQKGKQLEPESSSKHNPLAQPSPRVAAETFQQRKEEAKAQERDKEEKEKEKELKKDKELMKKNVSGTVKPYKNFHPDEDCDNLRDALGEYGIDEEEITRILSNRSNAQRQELKKTYLNKFTRDLIKDLQSQLQGDFEEIVLALMMTPTEYDAYCLYEAMDGLGTTESTLIGILTTRDAQEKEAIATQYQKAYKTDLDSSLRGETSGDFQNLLVALAKGNRDQGSKVNTEMAKQDAKKLYKDGQISIDPKDEVFIEILVKRNHAQVKETFKQYEKLTGNDVYTAIINAMVGDAEDGYITLAKAIEDPVEFFAERLVSCFSGLGTNDNMLIRIVVSRSEIDLGDIKLRFEVLYKKSLSQVVGVECKGDYKNMLLAIIDEK